MSHSQTVLDLPKTVREWRSSGWESEGTVPRDIWTPLEEFFRSKGLTLWNKSTTSTNSINCFPPNDSPRCPDGFAYTTKYQEESPNDTFFGLVKAIHCPARTSNNHDVLIRLIAKGDQGLNHLQALRRLASGEIAYRGENHAVPVLQEIAYDDMTFMTFPLMFTGFSRPWYYDLGEILDALSQVLQGVNFCHDRLVAHLDLDSDNILINFRGGACQEIGFEDLPISAPFRKFFPVRYFLNDFELAVCFDEDSDPSTRQVRGLPTVDILDGEYGRIAALEMLLDAPYCPFQADVWQLGRLFKEEFGHLGDVSGPMVELFLDMSAEDPGTRPTVAEALARVLHLRATLSPEVLATRVVRPPEVDIPISP